jgi:hypothetical protein
MVWSRRSAEVALCFVALSVTACAGYDPNLFGTGDVVGRQIDKAYAERNACLARNVHADATNGDMTVAAHTATAACQPQIDHLVAVSNPSRDPKVTAAIRQDSEFRALGYLKRAGNNGATAALP